MAEAKKLLAKALLLCETDGQSDTVTAQVPAAGAKLRAGGSVLLYTYEGEPAQPMDMICVPDVRGLSIVEASRALRARGLEMQLQGSGLAVRQSPAAGQYAALGDAVTVTFELPGNGENEHAAIKISP